MVPLLVVPLLPRLLLHQPWALIPSVRHLLPLVPRLRLQPWVQIPSVLLRQLPPPPRPWVRIPSVLLRPLLQELLQLARLTNPTPPILSAQLLPPNPDHSV